MLDSADRSGKRAATMREGNPEFWEPLKDAAEWLEHYRHFWEQSFDRLADYLGELQAKEEKDGHEDEH